MYSAAEEDAAAGRNIPAVAKPGCFNQLKARLLPSSNRLLPKASSTEFVLLKDRRRGSTGATNMESMERRVRKNAKSESEANAKLAMVKKFVKRDTITLRFTQDELNGLISLFETNAEADEDAAGGGGGGGSEMVITRAKFGEIFGVDGACLPPPSHRSTTLPRRCGRRGSACSFQHAPLATRV